MVIQKMRGAHNRKKFPPEMPPPAESLPPFSLPLPTTNGRPGGGVFFPPRTNCWVRVFRSLPWRPVCSPLESWPLVHERPPKFSQLVGKIGTAYQAPQMNRAEGKAMGPCQPEHHKNESCPRKWPSTDPLVFQQCLYVGLCGLLFQKLPPMGFFPSNSSTGRLVVYFFGPLK